MPHHSSSPLTPSISSNRWRTALAGLTALALTGLTLPASADIPASERTVLDALYNQADGANWNDNSGWTGAAGTECNWYGITCDAAEDHVTWIVLSDNGLSGTLPDLSDLTALGRFAVFDNNLSGPLPALPTSIINFTAKNNSLSGFIPDLSALPTLQGFDVSNNDLSGPLPALPTSIIDFRAYSNDLNGSIPDLSVLTVLRHFGVSNNDLSGSLPALPTSIRAFGAHVNHLDGQIPDLSTLTDLRDFYVQHNKLSGAPASAPPESLIYVTVCPNYLELSGDPAIDSGWETATGNTPWNQGCTSAPPAPMEATAIPTLSAWSLALLSILLGGIAIWRRPNAA